MEFSTLVTFSHSVAQPYVCIHPSIYYFVLTQQMKSLLPTLFAPAEVWEVNTTEASSLLIASRNDVCRADASIFNGHRTKDPAILEPYL
ncbi:hypothetical protein HPB47_011310 [Ixodes persulcatus]|uniref:Uncharacterized protein n=1 Tax=Ixodes persulcatus TaxID=34615 RepID=A0AC60NWN6_IXOPE|nr:hypothetical protein HPB47_011310 [Ixodes persulcatus]